MISGADVFAIRLVITWSNGNRAVNVADFVVIYIWVVIIMMYTISARVMHIFDPK